MSRQKSKVVGELTESIFQTQILALGGRISKPYGDSSKYDFITDFNGVLNRVQVKSAYNHKNRYAINCFYGGKKKHKNYDSNDIDLIAAYVSDLGVWYIIPVEALKNRSSLALFTKVENSKSKTEIYRQNWNLLTKGD